MKKYNYIRLSKTKKLRYMGNFFKKKLYIIFLPGFMSNIEGEKPKAFKRYAVRKKLGFLTLDYSGHGKSSGKFTKGNISQWSNDTKILIRRFIKKNNFIMIGSSMGSWIALNQFRYFKNQIKGFIGIGSAPEFLEKLMWKKFNKEVKKTIINKKIYYLKKDDFVYPITKQLIFDGRKNKVLNNKINLKISLVLLHGTNDKTVPLNFSRSILKVCKKSKKKFVIIKNGNHSLSRKSDLKKICNELRKIVNYIRLN